MSVWTQTEIMIKHVDPLDIELPDAEPTAPTLLAWIWLRICGLIL